MQFREEVRNLSPYIPGEQPHPRSRVIKINTNENPYPPSPLAMRKGQEILQDGLLKRYPQPSSDTLRETIAKNYSLDIDNILITNGSDEAIRLLFTACLEDGDTLGYPDPTYSAYPVFADVTLEKIQIQKFPLRENLSFPWEKMHSSRAKLMAFANPNAPTALLESKKDIYHFLDNFEGFTLCDEAYIDFAPEGSSMIEEVNRYDRLFVSRTLSKSYSLAGLRVGFLAGKKENIALLHKIKDSYNVGLLDQEIANSAIQDQDYFLQTRNRIIKTRVRIAEALERMGFFLRESHTNFLFAKPPKTVEAQSLFEELRNRGIYVRHFSSGIASQYIRISIGTDDEMDSFLEEAHSIISQYPKQLP